jgi:glycosyltransferase involved in cell wall biosynthesis
MSRAFNRLGVEVEVVRADENTWFDRYVIHRINKLAHSFRLLPKSRHLFGEHPLAHRNYRSAKLLAAYQSFQPDLTFLIRGIRFRDDVLTQTRPLFGWWVEHEGRVSEALKERHLFDGYFFMNQSCVKAAFDVGYDHADFLAHAVDPDAFKPIPGASKIYDACFVGNWSPKRQDYLEAALEVTPNIALYGSRWLRKCWNRPAILRAWKGRYIEGDLLNRLYNASRIVLNITNWGKGEGKARSGMNMRVLEVPATGAFLLTDESLELEAFLEPDRHVGTYASREDFAQRLRHFLNNDVLRNSIAEAGCAHVRQRHTYDHVASHIAIKYAEWVASARR